MISLQKMRKQEGFTLVELLIVIAIIAILATISITLYSGAQSRARDSKRQADIKTLQTQLEAFYASNNYYPSLADINSDTWRTANMKSLDPASLKDPSGSVSTLSGSQATASGKQYGYVALDAANAACTAAGTQCASYKLSSYLEGTKAVYEKNALD